MVLLYLHCDFGTYLHYDGVTLLNEETEQQYDLWKPAPLPDNSHWNQNFSRLTL